MYRPGGPCRRWSAQTCRHSADDSFCAPLSLLMSEARLFDLLHGSALARLADGTTCQIVSAANHFVASDGNELNRFGFAGFKAHGGSGGDVESHAVGLFA